MWPRDPPRRLPFGPPPPVPIYNYNFSSRDIDAFLPAGLRRHSHNHVHHYNDNHQRRHHHRRQSIFALDISDSDFSPADTSVDRYHIDSEVDFASFPFPPRPLPPFEDRPASPPLRRHSLMQSFREVQIKLPPGAPNVPRDMILILPGTLTQLKIAMYSESRHVETVRVAVAGESRLGDVLRQVLHERYQESVRACVRCRAGWRDVGMQVKVSEVRGGEPEVDIKVAVEDRGDRHSGDERAVAARGWDSEAGRGEAWRR